MSNLSKLKAAISLGDLADLIGFTASGLSYVLYKQPAAQKYAEFEIPKKNGELRKISAPLGALKEIQRGLADLLNSCRIELLEASNRRPMSHGFVKKPPPETKLPKHLREPLSILTNAHTHKNRRYVLNIDIADFFPSFNFGRVRGFFIKNHSFELDPKVATVIAQIACLDNALPQGSPCSPVIADMVGHILDVRLANLAKDVGATYSRYADDLTFSTSKKDFPAALATPGATIDEPWELGAPLLKIVEKTGFKVNNSKTRLQIRQSRQTVTGLTVNAKVNINVDYWRSARSMCHSLFSSGSYYRPSPKGAATETITNLDPLAGIMSHIYRVKKKSGIQPKGKNPQDEKRAENMVFGHLTHERFWFYRYFIAPARPLIICEGPTDSIYLKHAIRHLPAFQPRLGKMTAEGLVSTTTFFNYENTAHRVLGLSGGGAVLMGFISRFRRSLKPYKHRPMEHPVIILFDNDSGLPKKALTQIKEQFAVDITHASTQPFYHLTDNLYLVKTPEKTGKDPASCIEDLFDDAAKALEHEGKVLHVEKEGLDKSKHLDKMQFAHKIVALNASTITWDGFAPLLDRIVAVLDHYKAPPK